MASQRVSKVLGVFFIALALVLAGCTGQIPEDASGQSGEKLKIGAILPLSGSISAWGQSTRKGMDLAKKKLSEQGTDIDIIYEDSKLDPKTGLKAYQKLTKTNDVDVIVSALSSITVPLISRADQDNIPVIGVAMDTEDIPNRSEYVMRFSPGEKHQTQTFFDSEQIEEYDSISIIHAQDKWATSVTQRLQNLAEENDIEVKNVEKFQVAAKDLKTQLTKIKQSNPDAIFYMTIAPTTTVELFEQATELGINKDMLTPNPYHYGNGPIRKLIGEAPGDSYALAFPFQVQGEENNFVRDYREEYNGTAYGYAALAYDAVLLTGQATGGQSMSGSEIVENIENIDTYQSVNGPVEVKDNGKISPPLQIVKVENNKLKQVN